jgi:hypothetical protein
MHVILTKLAVVLLARQLRPSLIGNICTFVSILVTDTHLQSLKVVITTRMHLFPILSPVFGYKILISV